MIASSSSGSPSSSTRSNTDKPTNNSDNELAWSTEDDHQHKINGGTQTSGYRIESDSMGDIEVPADHYWGALTQRSLIHFSIGNDRMQKAVYYAYGYL